MKKILLSAGSNNPQSINRMLITYTAGLIPSPTTIVNLTQYPLPLYSEDLEKKEGAPENAKNLLEIINQHDAFIFAVPEHNGSLPAFFKNTLDWISRVQKNYRIFDNKPVLLLSTSPGPGGGKTALSHASEVFSRLGGKVSYQYSLPSFYKNVVTTETKFLISNNEFESDLKGVISKFLTYFRKEENPGPIYNVKS